MVLPSPQRGQERAAEAIHNNGDYTGEAPTTEPLWWNNKEPFRRYKDRISLEIGLVSRRETRLADCCCVHSNLKERTTFSAMEPTKERRQSSRRASTLSI